LDLLQFLATPSRPSQPDGRALYAYRCTDEEYQALGDALRERLPQRAARLWSRRDCAAFCLFVAEWYQREYPGGPWRRWEGALGALGLGAGPTPEERGAIVCRGMAWWRRQVWVHAGRAQYLASLVCEGGIPRAWLRPRESAALLVFLRELLEHLHDFSMSGHEPLDDLIAIAESRARTLPTLLRNPATYRFSATAAAAAWRIRQQVGDLPEGFNLAWLGGAFPRWEEEFPFRLEGDEVIALLRALFQHTDEVVRRGNSWLRFDTTFTGDPAEGVTLERTLRFPAKLSDEDFEGVFGCSADEAPRRMTLRARHGADLHLLGTLLRRGAWWSLQRVDGPPIRGAGALVLEALSGAGVDLEGREVPGAAPLGEMPWVFREAGRAWRMVAAGSCRRREETLWIAAPEGWDIQGDTRPVGVVNGRALHRARGAVACRGPERELVRVRAGQPQDSDEEYFLRGSRASLRGADEVVWRGRPRLVKRTAAGALVEARGRLMARGPAGWSLETPANPWLGERALRLVSYDGELLWAGRATMLPADFSCRSEPGAREQPGALIVSGRGVNQVGVPHRALTYRAHPAHREGDRWQLPIAPGSNPPHLVRLNLMVQGHRVGLDVPFPSRWARFEGRDGAPLATGGTIHISRLGACRALAFAPGAGMLAVSLQLRGAHHRGTPAVRMFHRGDGLFELPLEATREVLDRMLASTIHQDAYVRLMVFQPGGRPFPPHHLDLRRYDAKLVPHREVGGIQAVALKELPADLDPDDLEVEVWSLLAPQDGPAPLPRLRSARFDTPAWLFADPKRPPGPWLVTSRERGWFRGRPLLCSVWGEAGARSPLQAAIDTPDKGARAQTLDAVMIDLERDTTHPDWTIVQGYLAFLGEIPPSAFSILQRLAERPRMAALCALTASPDRLEAVWDGMEELPFLWCLLSMDAWTDALATWHADLRRTLTPLGMAELAVQSLLSQVARLRRRHPVIDLAFRRFLEHSKLSVGWSPPPEFGLAELPQALDFVTSGLDHHRGQLLQRRANAQWPAPFSQDELRALLEGAAPLARERRGDPGYQTQIVNAPLGAALHAVCGRPAPGGRAGAFRTARDFDPDYFDEVYRVAAIYFEGRQRQGECP